MKYSSIFTKYLGTKSSHSSRMMHEYYSVVGIVYPEICADCFASV